jgi:hypothetical protein
MHLDQLPSVRVSDMRRSGALTLNMERVTATLQGDGGAPVSSVVGVTRLRMRSGGVFLQFLCGHCGRRAQVLRLHVGRILCGRCTGLRYWCEGKPAVRRAQHRVERLKATRFHGAPVSNRPGRTMERRARLTASLHRSEAIVRQHFARRILVALQAAVIFCETSGPTKWDIDESPAGNHRRHRPDGGTISGSRADRDYRMSIYVQI